MGASSQPRDAKPAAGKVPLRTFAHQASLPQLPIPDLIATKDKLLKSSKPIARSDKEWKEFASKVEDFFSTNGRGQELQNRLKNYAKTQKRNWLDRLWLSKAYLSYRESSVINVSYWLLFLEDHPNQPAALVETPPKKGVVGTPWQIERAAGLVQNLLSYKERLDREEIAPEYMQKTTPLSMDQYTLLYGGTRIPGSPEDLIVTQHPNHNRHIVVLVKDQVFKVDVLGPKGERITNEEIKRLLKSCVDAALSTPAEAPVTIFATNHRDRTYEYTEELLALSPKNRENHQIMVDALFALCLDDYSTEDSIDSRHKQFFHGFDGKNRWADKELQFIVANNGRAGMMGEHSPSDAAVPNQIVNWVLEHEPAPEPPTAQPSLKLAQPTKLKWAVSPTTLANVKESEEYILKWINTCDSLVLDFKDYGAGFVKKTVKVSPDAYAQMMLQMTFKRMYKWPTQVYETASTRQFDLGRTETTRVCSIDSENFCNAFDNSKVPAAAKVKLLRTACEAHVKYSKEASAGQGIDRHLLGLKCMNKPGEPLHPLFGDELYNRGSHHRISTSNLSVSSRTLAGFGPTAPDGYGSNYNTQENWMLFSISSLRSSSDVNTGAFRDTLQQVLKDSKKLIEQGVAELGEVKPKAKL
ncbi:acyltransferase ChoActase/COT/CPT [Gonapodya prolifera JEL478]|uniref:Acyltransferase ChoActase/COT/CPT n=1 Tax=Gonapodya prolifera (strain JEL478) TaxID=1344416 RepID=A0A139AVC1_GONPJ|nr:acyltransferase ChoActase/COT/CPT [Gonapodya prolifera JEL478]|eukprot:KXS20680.1 acyltransferase ChoActase/COT/CPT [Gonapodya prolifera JEL478]